MFVSVRLLEQQFSFSRTRKFLRFKILICSIMQRRKGTFWHCCLTALYTVQNERGFVSAEPLALFFFILLQNLCAKSLKTAKNDGSFASGSGPCLLAPLLREMQVLAENPEKPSQLITFMNCEALDLLVDSSHRGESPCVCAEVVPKVCAQVYWLLHI